MLGSERVFAIYFFGLVLPLEEIPVCVLEFHSIFLILMLWQSGLLLAIAGKGNSEVVLHMFVQELCTY